MFVVVKVDNFSLIVDMCAIINVNCFPNSSHVSHTSLNVLNLFEKIILCLDKYLVE